MYTSHGCNTPNFLAFPEASADLLFGLALLAQPALYTAYGLSCAPPGAAPPSASAVLLPGSEMPTARRDASRREACTGRIVSLPSLPCDVWLDFTRGGWDS
jgi:hypothetical protein